MFGLQDCIPLCPYKAISRDEERAIAVIDQALCKGCGTCVAACPSGAAMQHLFSDEQIDAELEGLMAMSDSTPQPAEHRIPPAHRGLHVQLVQLHGVRLGRHVTDQVLALRAHHSRDVQRARRSDLRAQSLRLGGRRRDDRRLPSGRLPLHRTELQDDPPHAMLRYFLEQMGIEADRLRLVWASAAEGQHLAESIDQFVADVRQMGPLNWSANWEDDGQRTAALEEIVREHAEAMEVLA